jgi:DnaD/phage-associated family protein
MSEEKKPPIKLYRQSSKGIEFKSERKPGEVRIPNSVYDIWMPLLGIEVIGVYAVYCRLEREGQVKGLTQPQIATSCKIGTRRLDDINDILQEHGFIAVYRPDNKQKSKHEKTQITIKDPPTFVKSEFITKHDEGRKVKYMPLTAWLVEDSTALSNDYAPRSQMEMRSSESALSNGNAGALSNGNAPSIATLKDIATLELQPSTARSSAAPLPVVTASTLDALIFTPEMLPFKPNAIKETAHTSQNGKAPPPVSPPPSPSDDFNIVRLHRETWPKTEITPALKDILYAAALKYSREWIIDAFKEAAMNNAKTWKYCERILENWERDGRTSKLALVPKPADSPPPAVKLPPPKLPKPQLPKASGGDNGNS